MQRCSENANVSGKGRQGQGQGFALIGLLQPRHTWKVQTIKQLPSCTREGGPAHDGRRQRRRRRRDQSNRPGADIKHLTTSVAGAVGKESQQP